MAANDKAHYQVAVDDKHPVAEVAARLRAAGMEVSDVLPAIGIVAGAANPRELESLKRIEGVAAIDASSDVEAVDGK